MVVKKEIVGLNYRYPLHNLEGQKGQLPYLEPAPVVIHIQYYTSFFEIHDAALEKNLNSFLFFCP